VVLPGRLDAAGYCAGSLTAALSERVALAGGLDVSPMGVGAWSWGDSLFWGYDDSQEVVAGLCVCACVRVCARARVRPEGLHLI
jgi:hypothetical protein